MQVSWFEDNYHSTLMKCLNNAWNKINAKHLNCNLVTAVYMKVGSHDPIFSSNYSSIHFLKITIGCVNANFDKFLTFFLCIG